MRKNNIVSTWSTYVSIMYFVKRLSMHFKAYYITCLNKLKYKQKLS